jgi:hypothetical protein
MLPIGASKLTCLKNMKRLLAALSALLVGPAKADDGAKLGSEQDRIRQMLFASQSLKEQVGCLDSNTPNGPFRLTIEASKLIEGGQRDEAKTRLREILAMPDLETRTILWTWSSLREVGENPDPKLAFEVLGVVLEVPVNGGFDTLAAYADGSARYLNYSGSAIFWDAPDTTVKALCEKLIDEAASAGTATEPRSTLKLPRDRAQVTLLTRSGNYVASMPGPVMQAGAKLMMVMMDRAKKKP